MQTIGLRSRLYVLRMASQRAGSTGLLRTNSSPERTPRLSLGPTPAKQMLYNPSTKLEVKEMTVENIAPAARLSVGEVAQRAGVAVSTIHFYESKGLISSVRNGGNQRRYTSDVLRYLAIIKVAQRAGIPLEEIKDALGPYEPGRRVTAAQWGVVASGWRASLDQRIHNLEMLRDKLSGCIGCGCLSLNECPLRNPNDVLGQEGSGARILDR